MELRTQTVTSTDAQGRTTTNTYSYQERVVTWRANTNYQFNSWKDTSRELRGLEMYNMIKLRSRKIWTFADDETERDYYRKQTAFIEANKSDQNQSFFFGMEIYGFKSHLLAEVQLGTKPLCLDNTCYWIFSVLTLSVFYRYWFDSISITKKEYTFVKQLSIHPN